MIASIVMHISLIVIVSITQVSLLTTWPWPVNIANIGLAVVIFLITISWFERGLMWAVVLGFILDLYSNNIFGMSIITLLLTALVVDYFHRNFFTNYSLYSLTVLSIFGSITFALLDYGAYFITYLIKNEGVLSTVWHVLSYYVWQLIFTLIIAYILFILFRLIGSTLRSNVISEIKTNI